MGKKYTTVDEYVADFSGVTRQRVDEIRAKIFELIPSVTEKISYKDLLQYNNAIVVTRHASALAA
jgi:uncharacterized protein YdhG (YjbR/CyaY superfamily)